MSKSATNPLLDQAWRYSDDVWTGGFDFKPFRKTVLNYDQSVTHFKRDTTYKLDQGQLEQADFPCEFENFIAQPHPHVERHLIVARTGRVQLRAGRHAPRQLCFDVHVDVLQLWLPSKPSNRDLPADVVESFDNGHLFLLGEDADPAKHRRVGDGTQDVLSPQPPIERNGFSEPRDIRVGSAGKPPAA